MEDKYNTLWVEAAYENFSTAKADGDVALARAIAADTSDAGFVTEAKQMLAELEEVII